MKKAHLIYAAAVGIGILALYLAIRKSKEHDNCVYREKNFDSDYEDGQCADTVAFDENIELPFRYEILNEPEADTYYGDEYEGDVEDNFFIDSADEMPVDNEDDIEESLFIDSAADLDAAPNENTAADVQNQKIELMRKIREEDQIPVFRSETEEFIFWSEAIEKARKLWKSEIYTEIYSVRFSTVMRYIIRKKSASASGLQKEFYISYSTAKKIMQILTDCHLVSQLRGTYPRYVWIAEDMWIKVNCHN